MRVAAQTWPLGYAMHQSPDDIFAAHFWAWPDPALKRDAHGRVLFVNAAFLQLFGGRVEDWRGQTVQGWNPPQPGPAPVRFEIRTPAAGGHPEQIYDWMEVCSPDGSAFALARNVTVFVANHPSPDGTKVNPSVIETEPVAQAQTDTHTHTHTHSPTEAPVASVDTVADAIIADALPTAAPELVTPDATPVSETASPAPIAEAPSLDVPDIHVPPLEAPDISVPDIHAAPEIASQPSETANTSPEHVAAPDIDLPAPSHVPIASAADPIIDAAVPLTPTPAPMADRQQEPERAYERRALPIEDDEAVLGNNWRDAVIAKAVGVVDAPEETRDVASAEVQKPSPTESGSIRILLAEDNAINALLTRTLLEAEGHTVETVEDGQLAVEAMKSSNFDMIFMDMRMPNMDGLEATRKIRTLPNVPSSLPIVALTANAFDDDRNACFDSGMNDFMTKPVSAEELSEMVARWTGQSEQALAS